jgi:S1-C subfamily serine protease
VPFVEKDVGRDYTAAMEMIRRSGQQGVPVITAENEVLVGFDEVGLSRIAAKYAGPKRPPLGLLGADAQHYLARHPEHAENVPANTKGVYVGQVRPDSVAERSGLKTGDVITSVAGKRVRDLNMLDQMISTVEPGAPVSVSYLRNGKDESTTLQF